jgi:DeoR/GlpR family transcriptional regulator of sugar metabolism
MTERSYRPDERLDRILDLLARQETASLSEVLAATEASEATVRRDLDKLARRGLISRTRGGARRVYRGSPLDEEFTHRQRRNARAKAAIAMRAADLVPSGATLFLNDGSTTLALAGELTRRDLDLWVATCALNVAELLARESRFDVTVVGGSLRHSSFGTNGPLATEAIRTLHADVAFIGCDGFHVRDGVRSNNVHDAEVGRALSEQADATVVLADASKLGNDALARTIPWEQVDRLVTDAHDAELEQALTLAGTELTSVAAAPA